MAVSTSCELVGLSRSAWYKPVRDWLEYARELIEALQEMVELYNRWGFWKYYGRDQPPHFPPPFKIVSVEVRHRILYASMYREQGLIL